MPCPCMGQEHSSHASTTRSHLALRPPFPTMGVLTALLPHTPQAPSGQEGGCPLRAGAMLMGSAVLSHKPCGSSGWEAAFSPPVISHIPHPGTILVPRVLPAGKGEGSFVAVWLALLLLVALGVTKELVGCDIVDIWQASSHILGRAGRVSV